jgi:hypothetical protein
MSTRDEYVESMKSAFVTLATQSTLAWFAVLTKGISETWFFKKLITIIFEQIYKYIATQSELAIFFKYIDTRVGRQSIDFQNAAMINWATQQNGTKEQKLEAEKNLIFHFNRFARLNS